MQFYEPLEQFDITLSYLRCPYHTSLTWLLWTHPFLIFLSFWSLNKFKNINIKVIVFTIFNFVKSTLLETLHIDKSPHIYYYYFLFISILISNFLGMVAYSFTVTSWFLFSFFFSSSFFIGSTLYGMSLHQFTFFRLFLPPGVPIFIAPVLILIEIVSYLSRVVSLAVRLFANMLSGHALLKILLGNLWICVLIGTQLKLFLIIVSFFPWVVIFLVTLLEYVIAILQAYVFLILSVIYISDAINLH